MIRKSYTAIFQLFSYHTQAYAKLISQGDNLIQLSKQWKILF